MPKFLVKLGDEQYCEWSTVVDAPVSSIMTLDGLKAYYRGQYGEEGMLMLPDRLARVERTGCSALSGCTAEELIACNRAGPKEGRLNLRQIIKLYSEARSL